MKIRIVAECGDAMKEEDVNRFVRSYLGLMFTVESIELVKGEEEDKQTAPTYERRLTKSKAFVLTPVEPVLGGRTHR